ncbi:MAG: enoyl-CoA hydratase/isomerase family protein [Candidatus Tectimicrobiota bacterium]
MADEVLWAIQDGIATLTLNRPEKRNAINLAMMERLTELLQTLEQHREVRVVVIRAAGSVFCSGRDLREMSEQQRSQEGARRGDVVQVFHQLETLRHPTIAMIQGDALAGGCELALHCDFRVAAEAARFGMPLARLGLVVPFALAGKLLEIIGPAFTRQFLLTAQPMTARRAYDIGMLHEVVASEELEQATMTLARTMAGNAPLALQGIKANILRHLSGGAQIAHQDLDDMVERTRRSADAREGVRAWLEKRPPVFRGE